MKNLKIAILLDKFPTTSETFIVNQICYLIDRGHEVKIFSFEKGKGSIIHQGILDYDLLNKTLYYEDYLPSKLKRYFPFIKFLFINYRSFDLFRYLKNASSRKSGLSRFNLNYFYQYKWILTPYKFDVIHAHFGQNGEYIAGIKSLGFLKKTKFFTSFHGYDLSPHLLDKYSHLYKSLFLEVDGIFVNSEYSKGLIQKITNTHIKILPAGPDTFKFQRNKEDHERIFNILFVGRLIKLKAPDLAIKIFHELIKRGLKGIRMTVIGEGDLRRDIDDLLNKLDIGKYVHIRGAQSQEEIKREMNNSKVFLFPGIQDENGRSETQGLVLQEAQAMELPVVISDVGGMKYGMIDGLSGFVVKEKDITGFADKIELLFKNEKLRIRMGKAGRQFVVKNFDSRKLGERLEKIYYE